MKSLPIVSSSQLPRIPYTFCFCVARRAWLIGIAFLEFDQFQLIYFCSSFLGYGISELFGIYVEVDEFFQSTASVIWQGLPILRYMRFWCRTKWREVVTPRDVLRNNFNSFSRTFFIFGVEVENAEIYMIFFLCEKKNYIYWLKNNIFTPFFSKMAFKCCKL